MSTLKQIRKSRRIKAVNMAKDLGITRQYLYLIENKAIPVNYEIRHKIAVYLDCKPINIDW